MALVGYCHVSEVHLDERDRERERETEGGYRHKDWSVVSTHFSKERKSSTMIKVTVIEENDMDNF